MTYYSNLNKSEFNGKLRNYLKKKCVTNFKSTLMVFRARLKLCHPNFVQNIYITQISKLAKFKNKQMISDFTTKINRKLKRC